MFSNLRTEGTRSNHHILDIDDEAAEAGYQYQPLRGRLLLMVEFKKRILLWTEMGMAVPMTFTYGGVVRTTTDITREPAWTVTDRDWEMVLMDVRVIQPEGPNECRW